MRVQVRGYTIKHMVCGGAMVGLQVALVVIAKSHIHRMKNSS